MIKPIKSKILFASSDHKDFFLTLKQKVNRYLKEQKIERSANFEMYVKSVFLLLLYVVSYFLLFINQVSAIGYIFTYGFIGLVTGLIGFNFSHDVMHGSYFISPFWNRFWSYLFDFNGTSSYVWKLSHNLQHHIYTNIPGHDDDIDKAILLRLSPKDKVYPFHQFQHIYALFLYLFTTINWVFYSDYKVMWMEYKKNVLPLKELVLFLFFKVLNAFLFIGLPLVLSSFSIWVTGIGYLFMHAVGGFTISIIFQLAHIVENVEYPFASEKHVIHRSWAEHELRTTSNFATESHFWNLVLGGLNFQIEHHLFPYLSHVHYKKIAPLVKETALEFGIPYNQYTSLKEAISSHLGQLKRFGKGSIG